MTTRKDTLIRVRDGELLSTQVKSGPAIAYDSPALTQQIINFNGIDVLIVSVVR